MALESIVFEVATDYDQVTHDAGVIFTRHQDDAGVALAPGELDSDSDFMNIVLGFDGEGSEDDEDGAEWEGTPYLLAVGYVGGLAVSAAMFMEVVPGEGQEVLGERSLALDLLVTEEEHAGQGYGGNLVRGIVQLAAEQEFDSVHASWIMDEREKTFWASCGFEEVPYKTVNGGVYRAVNAEAIPKTGTEMIVSPDVVDRLAKR